MMRFITQCIFSWLVCVHSVLTLEHHCTGSYKGMSYCEYYVGDPQSNIVIGAPHGGPLEPPSIPDRDAGCFIAGFCVYSHSCGIKDYINCPVKIDTDLFTKELSIMLRDELEELTGFRPHLIINNLQRGKMDGNREIHKATFDVPEAKLAYTQFNRFIKIARNSIIGNGLFIDMHGQRHMHGMNELGYLIPKASLNSNTTVAEDTSIRGLANRVLEDPADFDVILRGVRSLGYYLQIRGYEVVPSPKHFSPGNSHFFPGGHNTRKYGSLSGGVIDGIQIESHANVRTPEEGPTYIKNLAEAVKDFMDENNY